MANSERQHPRFEVNLSVEIEFLVDDKPERIKLQTLNISLGGFLVNGERKKYRFLGASALKVTAILPEPFGPIEFLASPIRKAIDGSIGFSIIQMSEDTEKTFSAFLSSSESS
jgi:hypothetical protein